MSAALENVERGAAELAEVTSLDGAVRAWQELEPNHREAAVLTTEHPIRIDAEPPANRFVGSAIAVLVDLLP